MFGKNKKTVEETSAEREARIDRVEKQLKIQLLSMEKKKGELFSKVMEARAKGFKSQEAQARGLLRKCMASYKRADGMLMTLELARQSRDLAVLNQEFVTCIGDLSKEMIYSVKKTDAKDAEKNYLKAMYVAGEQTKELDKMMEIGDYASAASMDNDTNFEFDKEIDLMIEDAENSGGNTISGRQRV